MKVLVTGGTGFVGSILISQLVNEAFEVDCVDNLRYGFNSVIAQLANFPNFKFHLHDLTRPFDSETWKKMEEMIEKADVVVHLAALVGYPLCEREKELATRLNVHVAQRIADLCKQYKTKCLYASTGSVYGKIKDICTEESQLNPLTHYAVTKFEAEQYILNNCSSIVFRFATAFGLSPRLRLDLFINDMVYRALSDGSVVVYQPKFRRTFIHVSDMSRLFVHAIRNMKKAEGVYNAGEDSLNCTKVEILDVIKKHLPHFYIAYGEFQADQDQRDYEVSYAKINKTGFQCQTGLEDGVAQLIEFLRILELKQIGIMGFNNVR